MAEGVSSTKPPPPDAARVWRGFRAAALPVEEFYSRLGSVFIPATVLLQSRIGLCAYIPTVTAGLPGKPDRVPDETALLFWRSQQAYREAFSTLAVRSYTLTHAAVYTPASSADFPVPFTGQLETDRPYHLRHDLVDWMQGEVTHLAGARRDDLAPAEFRVLVARVLTGAQGRSLTGAVTCSGDDYLVYWQVGFDRGQTIAELRDLLGWSHDSKAVPTALTVGLWDAWPGMVVTPGNSFNMQLSAYPSS